MQVDLRDVELPPGRTELPLELGMGEIQVLVPERHVRHHRRRRRASAPSTRGDGEQGGIDLDVADDAARRPACATCT